MESKYIEEDKLLILKVTEEIDEYSVQKIRRKADYEIERQNVKKIFEMCGILKLIPVVNL